MTLPPTATGLDLSLDGVDARFATADGQIEALAGLDLAARADSFTAVIGPNGCGKSTLLRGIARILKPAAGRVLLDGSDIHRMPTRDVAGLKVPDAGRVLVGGVAPVAGDGRVGLDFQQPRLVPWRSVIENVALPMELAGVAPEARRGRAEAALAQVGLASAAGLRPRELSGGMAQRAALARAMVGDPPVLLLDEPFSALDALTREEFDAELQRIWLERPRTVVFVTHSVAEAVALADRVLVMTPRPGRVARVVEVGLPRPRSVVVTADPRAAQVAAEVRDALASVHALEVRPWSEATEVGAA
jgi:NitT/TauT family transport system ATP-binding protein